jgi:hypothetical protein
LLIEATLLGWWRLPTSARLRRFRLWLALHPWLVELLVLAVVITVAVEVTAMLRPLAWSLLALMPQSRPLRQRLARRVGRCCAIGKCGWWRCWPWEPCLLRLVSIDMAAADPVLRGLVFIDVGLLMVAVNAIATRFRERFGG